MQARYQRHIDNLAQQHLKAVSTRLDGVVRRLGAGLAGTLADGVEVAALLRY